MTGMDNMSIYNALRTPPKEALTPITEGRMKGKSDISPMWRIKALTERFGPCGIGWKYEMTRQWLETGAEGSIKAFCNILLYIKYDDKWSEAIPGTGGSAFVAKERNGLYTSDECYKMALTDAISVACKALGMAGDVYWQNDPTKYIERPKPEPDKPGPICNRCGKRLQPVRGRDGRTRTPEQTADYSLKTYGHVLCMNCQKQERANDRADGYKGGER